MPTAFEPRALDGKTAERLLIGALHPDDAPPGYQRVARFTQTFRRGLVPDAAEAPQHFLNLLQVTVRASGQERHRGIHRHRLSQVAAASVISVVALASSLATVGALPASVQEATTTVVRAVAVVLPHAEHRQGSPAPPTGPSHASHASPSTTVSLSTAARLRVNRSSGVAPARTVSPVVNTARAQTTTVSRSAAEPSTAPATPPTANPGTDAPPGPVVTPPVPPVNHGPPIPPGSGHHPPRHHHRRPKASRRTRHPSA